MTTAKVNARTLAMYGHTAEALRRVMVERGLSKGDVGMAANPNLKVPTGSSSGWIRGVMPIPEKYRQPLADALGLTLADLTPRPLNTEGEPTPNKPRQYALRAIRKAQQRVPDGREQRAAANGHGKALIVREPVMPEAFVSAEHPSGLTFRTTSDGRAVISLTIETDQVRGRALMRMLMDITELQGDRH